MVKMCALQTVKILREKMLTQLVYFREVTTLFYLRAWLVCFVHISFILVVKIDYLLFRKLFQNSRALGLFCCAFSSLHGQSTIFRATIF